MTYGTSRVSAYKLIEDALNLKETKVFDQIVNPDGSKTSVLNKKETLLARQKQELLRVRRGLEDHPGVRQGLLDAVRIDQVAVVRQGDLAQPAPRRERLGVAHVAPARGGVAHVPDGDVPREPREDVPAEDLAGQPQPLERFDAPAAVKQNRRWRIIS